MKKILIMLIMAFAFSVIGGVSAEAGEIDVLLNKLVEKGVLTPLEAQIIQDETMAQVSDELAKQKSYALPSWVQKIKIKGDIRLRYQFEDKKGSQTRNRGRIRYRLGVIAKPVDKVEIGAGLASGGHGDPRSTNQSFDETFDQHSIELDYAYIEYAPYSWMKMVGGKHKRKAYLWEPTDLLWDGDINPEGGAISLTGPSTENTETWMNAGVWVLEESGSDTSDPFMMFVQPGLKWKDGDFDAKLAYTYYDFNDVRESSLTNEGSGNTRTTGGDYTYSYDSHHAGAEFGVKKPFDLPLERVAVFGECVNAVDPDDENTGFAAGVKFGSKEVSNPGTWQFKYIYAELGKDAWLDAFPDSDRYGGKTNIKSHEFVLQYALNKNVIFGLDYYYSDILEGTSAQQNLFQADLNLKF